MRSVVCIWPTCSLLMAPELNLWNVAVLFFLTFRFKKNLKSSLNKIDLQNVFVKFMDVFPVSCRAVFLSSFRMFLTWTLIILCSCFSLSACWESAVFFSLFFVFVFNQTLFLDNSAPQLWVGVVMYVQLSVELTSLWTGALAPAWGPSEGCKAS